MLKYSVELSEIDFAVVRLALLYRIEDQEKLVRGFERLAEREPVGKRREACAAEAAVVKNEAMSAKRILDELYRLSPILPQGGEKNHV